MLTRRHSRGFLKSGSGSGSGKEDKRGPLPAVSMCLAGFWLAGCASNKLKKSADFAVFLQPFRATMPVSLSLENGSVDML